MTEINPTHCTHATRPVTVVAFVLLAILLAVFAMPAWADEVDDKRTELQAARDQLSQKTQELSDLTLQVEDAQSEIKRIEGELKELSEGISKAQEEHAHQQERLADVSVLMYKTDPATLLDTFAESESFSELLGRVYQIESIARQAAGLAEQEAATAEKLKSSYEMASFLLDEQQDARDELNTKLAAAEQARADLETQVAQSESDLEAAEQRAAAEALARAAAAAAASQAAAPTVAPAQNQEQTQAQDPVQEQPAQESNTSTQEQSGGSGSTNTQAGQTQSDTSGAGWQTGVASAYGGSSDPYTPNPGTTATGAVCDDWSMGVAVPMAWGPGAYYGRQVEISYNGQSVIATVNDCGGMGGGSRALDLQPGVFKAFGCSTCQDWGLRTVSYRFL